MLTKELLERLEFTEDEIKQMDGYKVIGLPLNKAVEKLYWYNYYEWAITIALPAFDEKEVKCYLAVDIRTQKDFKRLVSNRSNQYIELYEMWRNIR